MPDKITMDKRIHLGYGQIGEDYVLAGRHLGFDIWIDEIEKAFGPANDQDGGASQRIFGTLLTWLQEKQTPVFVMATSNDISRLPPELLRKGRFDEIFFVDLPRADIRAEVLRVHLEKRGREPERTLLSLIFLGE